MIKARPPRLEQIFQTYVPPLFFVTICTIHRQKIGDLEAAHHAFEAYVRRVREEFGVAAGIFRSRVARRRELYPEMGIRARESCSRRTGCTGR